MGGGFGRRGRQGADRGQAAEHEESGQAEVPESAASHGVALRRSSKVGVEQMAWNNRGLRALSSGRFELSQPPVIRSMPMHAFPRPTFCHRSPAPGERSRWLAGRVRGTQAGSSQ
ncbi:hypothetical protein RGQ21_73330 [Kitasatospora aureofaciens]|nr:hypothetical protein RGQ21_73330 [Kitasatospora aureofaciens]